MDLVVARPEGLFCPPGNFYIDPWRPVDRAIITHGHADHARSGHAHYLTSAPGAAIVRARLGGVSLDTLAYGEYIVHNGVRISLHPAGHVLGSAQVRLEHEGAVWVASGDYTLQADGTCAPFEPVRCHTFITESTFGLPIYRWEAPDILNARINAWWQSNAESGRPSIVFCYAFGKAQRVLHGLDTSIGPVIVHAVVDTLNAIYRRAAVWLAPSLRVSDITSSTAMERAIVIAPPSAQGSAWMRRFGSYVDAFASGWMQVRGARRRRAVDQGFVMSDHADWPGLLDAIAATGAERVIATHGSVPTLVRWLSEQGLSAEGFSTEYGDEDEATAAQPDEHA
jgi:putative mRNA 3-end processing factor